MELKKLKISKTVTVDSRITLNCRLNAMSLNQLLAAKTVAADS